MKEATVERCPTLDELPPAADRKLPPQELTTRELTDRRALFEPSTAVERGESVRPDRDTLVRARLAARLIPTQTGLELPRMMRVSLTPDRVRVEGAWSSAAQRPDLNGRPFALPQLRADLNGLDTRVRVLTASLPADWPRRTAAGLTRAIAFERLVQELGQTGPAVIRG